MLSGREFWPIAVSVAVCIVMAVIGNLWVGDALTTWYPTLKKPRFLAPLWAFIVVGIAVYAIEGVILYRLLVYVETAEGTWFAFTALTVVMACNEAWNFAFFGLRRTLAALVGIVAFSAPLLILMTALFAYDSLSGWLLLPYCGWVAYDVWWVYQLWWLNPQTR